MKLRARLRDCLYLNWALPLEALPPAPSPLRYERHLLPGLHGGERREVVFGSAVLFHHEALRLAAFPFARIGYPQLNVRLYVLDEQGVPSVLFRRMLMPGWVAAGARLATRQPIERAHLHFPRPSLDPGEDAWSWRASLSRGQGEALTVEARREGTGPASLPALGGWDPMVRYFVDRTRGYASFNGALRRVETRHPDATVWPVRAEVRSPGFLPEAFGLNPEAGLPPLHSAWLAPEIPFVFDVTLLPRLSLAPSLPQPAAGRVGRPQEVQRIHSHSSADTRLAATSEQRQLIDCPQGGNRELYSNLRALRRSHRFSLQFPADGDNRGYAPLPRARLSQDARAILTGQ